MDSESGTVKIHTNKVVNFIVSIITLVIILLILFLWGGWDGSFKESIILAIFGIAFFIFSVSWLLSDKIYLLVSPEGLTIKGLAVATFYKWNQIDHIEPVSSAELAPEFLRYLLWFNVFKPKSNMVGISFNETSPLGKTTRYISSYSMNPSELAKLLESYIQNYKKTLGN